MKYVVYPDLPPPPIDGLDITSSVIADLGRCATVTREGGQRVTGLRNHRYSLSSQNQNWSNWLRENLGFEYSKILMSHHGPELEIVVNPVGTIIPHTDGIRDWGLLWVTDTGGENVQTVFWQEKDHPIYRGRNANVTTYDTLTEVYRVKIPVGRWTLLNVGVLHSVENIIGIRKVLQINFENNSKVIKKWCS